MKLKTEFRIRQKGSPPALYRAICCMVPSAVRVDDVRMEARSGETLRLATIASLVALCKAAGLKRSEFGSIGTYGHVVLRQYDPEDLGTCDYLFVHGLSHGTTQDDDKRDKQGRLILLAKNAVQLNGFGQVNHQIVVSADARRSLEEARFQGLAFRDVGIYGRHAAEPCWELSTTVMLPKLANSGQLKCYATGPTDEVEPFTGDYARMLFIADPPYATGEAHYRRSDLLSLGLWDIGQTLEKLWIPEQSLVVSQRFYQHCLKHKIPLEVEPVRLDPD